MKSVRKSGHSIFPNAAMAVDGSARFPCSIKVEKGSSTIETEPSTQTVTTKNARTSESQERMPAREGWKDRTRRKDACPRKQNQKTCGWPQRNCSVRVMA